METKVYLIFPLQFVDQFEADLELTEMFCLPHIGNYRHVSPSPSVPEPYLNTVLVAKSKWEGLLESLFVHAVDGNLSLSQKTPFLRLYLPEMLPMHRLIPRVNAKVRWHECYG